MKIENCPVCSARVFYMKQKAHSGNPKPKTAMIDANPILGGNLFLTADSQNYEVMPRELIDQAKDRKMPLYVNHFATCTDRDALRELRRKRAEEKAAR